MFFYSVIHVNILFHFEQPTQHVKYCSVNFFYQFNDLSIIISPCRINMNFNIFNVMSFCFRIVYVSSVVPFKLSHACHHSDNFKLPKNVIMRCFRR